MAAALMLSGTDPYQSLVLPLSKALDSHEARVAPIATARYFDATLPRALAIIDGPMVAVELPESGPTYRLAPWVRCTGTTWTRMPATNLAERSPTLSISSTARGSTTTSKITYFLSRVSSVAVR